MGILEKLITTRKLSQGKEEIRWLQRGNYWNIAYASVYLRGEGGEGSYCALTHSEWMNEWKPPNRIRQLKYYAIPQSCNVYPSLPYRRSDFPSQTAQGRDYCDQSTSEHVPTQRITMNSHLVPTLNIVIHQQSFLSLPHLHSSPGSLTSSLTGRKEEVIKNLFRADNSRSVS